MQMKNLRYKAVVLVAKTTALNGGLHVESTLRDYQWTQTPLSDLFFFFNAAQLALNTITTLFNILW